MSFDGDAFYSYNTVLARRIRYKGKVAIVHDTTSFSSTTGKHQSHLRNAIPSSVTVFRINNGSFSQRLDFTPADLRDWYLKDGKPSKDYNPKTQKVEVVTSRYAHKRAQETLRQNKALCRAIEVCEYFKLSSRRLDIQRQNKMEAVDSAQSIVNAHEAKLTERRTNRDRLQHEHRIAKAIALAESIKADPSQIAHLSRWNLSNSLLESRPDLQAIVDDAFANRDALKIKAWRKGESVYFDYNGPAMLRSINGDMETSQGARVPLEAAEKTYRFALRVRSAGWQRNGEQFKIGMYDLDRVNEQGVIAGCHRVSWDEIFRFADAMGWQRIGEEVSAA